MNDLGVGHRAHPLAMGFYTIHEAARLIENGDVRRIRGWLSGHP